MAKVTCCRSCGMSELVEILNLGETPLANALLTEADLAKPETTYPLILLWCRECTLLQISENVPGEILFSHYFYHSSFSDAFLAHCKALATKIIDEKKLTSDSLVIDIASNDGYLLQFYKDAGVPVLGIEPAKNIAAEALKKGIDTRNDFFSEELAKTLPKADIVHANNVLPHVGDQRDFMKGIKAVLKPEGTAVIEFAYAIDTIDHLEFDQIYHEHMCYFSLTSLLRLAREAGLDITDVERIAMHGGSLRVSLSHEGTPVAPAVREMLEAEKAWGVDAQEAYDAFAKKVHALKDELVRMIDELKKNQKTIVAYGASAKGCTLLHFCGLGKEQLDYVVDRSTVKQGHYTPGTHLPIQPVETLMKDMPDYLLLLTWNFADEILKQQEKYRKNGGTCIVPVPWPKMV